MKSPRPPSSPSSVLIAVLGSSPAVLTETLWALAQKSPPVIPQRVVVVTTTHGATSLRDQLLTPRAEWSGLTVWQALRTKLLGSKDPHPPLLNLESPVIISAPDPTTGTSLPLEDIRTLADNAAAAEILLSTVRRFTTDPETQVLGLLAGGRKTMAALLHAAFSLSGRPGDRLLHIIVNAPFDDPRLTPPFFFPGQPGPAIHALPDSPTVKQNCARLDLADVPLVALGELVAAQTGNLPATFATLTRIAQNSLAAASLQTIPLNLDYTSTSRTLRINHYSCTIPEGRASVFCAQLIRDTLEDKDLSTRDALAARWGKSVNYTRPDGSSSYFTEDDISHALNVLRDQLSKNAGMPDLLIKRLFPLRSPIGLVREYVTVELHS